MAGKAPPTGVQPAPGQTAAGQGTAVGRTAPAGQATGPRPTSPPVTQATGATRPGGATTPPRPTLEGLRAWLATLDRKVGLRTYLGIAALILALATSAVAIVLAIDARDNSASNDDLNAISERVNELDAASEIDPAAIEGIEARLTSIEDQLSDAGASAGDGDTAERLDVLEDDIEELRGQISELETGSEP